MFVSQLVQVAPASRSAVTLGVAAALAAFSFGVPFDALAVGAVASGESLEPIVVTATRMASSLQTAPIGATVITSDQIQRAGVSDANEAIRKLAGVPAKSDLYNGRELTLDLRGYGSTADSNLVVMVDGIRISENEIASPRLSAIPVELIDRIEIIRGGSSVLWGEGATAGVINVILKSTGKDGASARVAGTGGSFNQRDLAADGRWARDAWAVDASVRRNRTDGYRANSAYAQDVGSLGVQWRLSGLHANARVQQETQDARMPGALSFAQFRANPRQATSPDDYAHVDETRYIGNVGYESREWGVQLDLGHRDRRSQSQYVSFGSPKSTSNSRQSQLTPRVVFDGVLSNTMLKAQMGLDFQDWRFNKHVSNGIEDGSQSSHAEFVFADWTLPSDTRIAFGARHEHVQKQDNYPGAGYDSPVSYVRADALKAHEISLNQTVAPHLDVYGRLASSYRLPNIDENRVTTSQLALHPQRSRDSEVGVKWSRSQQAATLRWFKQRSVDEIAFDPISYTNVNLEPTRRQGVELEVHMTVAERISLAGTWQHLSARYREGVNAGKEQVLVAPYSAALRLSFEVDDTQSVSVGWQYVAPMRFGSDSDNLCTNRIPSTRPIDATYRWSDKVWTVVVAGTNLANQHSYNYAYSCTSGSLYPDAGRAMKLTVARAF